MYLKFVDTSSHKTHSKIYNLKINPTILRGEIALLRYTMKIVLALTLVCLVEICELSGVGAFDGNLAAKKTRRAAEVPPQSNCAPYCDKPELLQECINPCIEQTKYPDIHIVTKRSASAKSTKAAPPAQCVPVCATFYTVEFLERCVQLCKAIDDAITAGIEHEHLPGECHIVCFP